MWDVRGGAVERRRAEGVTVLIPVQGFQGGLCSCKMIVGHRCTDTGSPRSRCSLLPVVLSVPNSSAKTLRADRCMNSLLCSCGKMKLKSDILRVAATSKLISLGIDVRITTLYLKMYY